MALKKKKKKDPGKEGRDGGKEGRDGNQEKTLSHNHLLLCLGLFVLFLEIESPCVGHAGLKLEILLPLLSECWNYSHVPPRQLTSYS
jgi:hypothetical protein